MHKTLKYFTYNSSCLFNEKMEESIQDVLNYTRKRLSVSTEVDLNDIINKFTESAIPDELGDATEYMSHLINDVIKDSLNLSSPRYIGHMTTLLPEFIIPLSSIMVVLNKNVVKTETAKVFTYLERQVLAMIHRQLYGMPEEFYNSHIQSAKSTLGIATSGGTIANLTALWCARNKALGPVGDFPGIDKAGIISALKHYGYTDVKVIGSSLLHYSVEKAMDILGLGTDNLIKIPADKDGHINIERVRSTVDACKKAGELVLSIVGIAGTTETGSVDSLEELAAIARDNDIHFHVDAAWGGPVIFSPKYRHILKGIEAADSITIDGHKQFYMPMGLGMVIIKDPTLTASIEKTSNYIIRSRSLDLGKKSVEGSRPAMTLLLHAALNILGKQGYEFLLNSGIQNAKTMADLIRQQPDFELLMEPELNIVNYRYITPDLIEAVKNNTLSEADNEYLNTFNRNVQKIQRNKGTTFVSRTTLNNLDYPCPVASLRAVLVNPLTTEADIREVLKEQAKIAESLVKK